MEDAENDKEAEILAKTPMYYSMVQANLLLKYAGLDVNRIMLCMVCEPFL
jgi:hypothetical protein